MHNRACIPLNGGCKSPGGTRWKVSVLGYPTRVVLRRINRRVSPRLDRIYKTRGVVSAFY